MRIKRNIELYFLRTFYHLKSLRFIALIPVAVINLLLPLLLYKDYHAAESDLFKYSLTTYASVFVPLFSSWWSMFILKEYLEADGNELLFTQKGKIKFIDVFLPFLLYIFNISIWFAVCVKRCPDLKLFFLWMYIACFFVFATAYFIAFLSKSMTATFLTVLIYTLVNYVVPFQKPTPFFYNSSLGFEFEAEFYPTYLPMLIGSVLFILVGIILNKHFSKFN